MYNRLRKKFVIRLTKPKFLLFSRIGNYTNRQMKETKLPKVFLKANEKNIYSAIGSEKWVLIATTDETGKTEELAKRLSDDFLSEALGNFRCFEVAGNSELARELSLEYPVALYIFVNDREPEYIFEFDEPECIFMEDIAQFLDDAASDILYGDELDL